MAAVFRSWLPWSPGLAKFSGPAERDSWLLIQASIAAFFCIKATLAVRVEAAYFGLTGSGLSDYVSRSGKIPEQIKMQVGVVGLDNVGVNLAGSLLRASGFSDYRVDNEPGGERAEAAVANRQDLD